MQKTRAFSCSGICTVFLLFFSLLLPLALPACGEAAFFQVHQINIGCGDAYMLLSGDTVILVDCGLDTDATNDNTPLFTYLSASGIDHVDAHIVTHYHNDHCFNINYINETYGTEDSIVYGPSPELCKDYVPLKNGSYRQMRDGDHLEIGPFVIDCVGPADGNTLGNTNYDSLNFFVTCGSRRFFFTGDWVDWLIKDRHPDLFVKVDVLSFPHHGLQRWCIQKSSMKLLNPDIILVPGRNRQTVRQYCRECDVNDEVQIYSVLDGNIVVLTNGDALELVTCVAPGEYTYGMAVPETMRTGEEEEEESLPGDVFQIHFQ